MAKLKTAVRNKLPKSDFGMPASRKYPMPDKSHAANAKARATQMVDKGKLSPSSAAKIKAKANKILDKKPTKSSHADDMKIHHKRLSMIEKGIDGMHKEHKKLRTKMHKMAMKY